jgi:small subunit ribosomal protein S8e
MTKWILRSRRKITGGLVNKSGKRKKFQRGRDFLPSKIGEAKVRSKRVKGGGKKRVALSINTANVFANGKMQKAKIISVTTNPADSQFTRRNIITKGAIILTDIGQARVTSRPGQVGSINAVLTEVQKEAKEPKGKKK